MRNRAFAVATGLLRDEGLRKTRVRQKTAAFELIEHALDLGAVGTARDQPLAQFSTRVFATCQQPNRGRFERKRSSRRGAKRHGASQMSAPLPSGLIRVGAGTPTVSRIFASISVAVSGCPLRKSRALSLPWPIFSPL